MIAFEERDDQIILVYYPERRGPSWLDHKLESGDSVTLSNTFTVRAEHLLGTASQDAIVDQHDDDNDHRLANGASLEAFFGQDDADDRRFAIGRFDDAYWTIHRDVLGLRHDLLIARSIGLRRQIFVATRNISIFGRIGELVDEQIVIGGPRPGAIPEEEFSRLLHDFPTSTQLDHYARARVSLVLREYLETMSDAEQRLTDYMARRARSKPKTGESPRDGIPAAYELELQKFKFVKDRLGEMLTDAESYSEAEWQSAVADVFLLIFPQYITVLHKVNVEDRYSNPSRSTIREIDLMLIRTDGCADIIEIKKPFKRALVSKGRYRDNHIPTRELSGSIMQVEKYVFHLSKSGRRGEADITTKHAARLPSGLEVRIVNPKAIILAGRDHDLSTEERFDLEFVRRKYSNVVDIISYDDLLRRLENVVAALTKRSGTSARTDASPLAGVANEH